VGPGDNSYTPTMSSPTTAKKEKIDLKNSKNASVWAKIKRKVTNASDDISKSQIIQKGGSFIDPIDASNLEVDMDNALGKGSFGAVYTGTYLGGKVAVKVLHIVDKKDFPNEVSILCNIRHPNCVLCIGYTIEPNCAIIMEWMPFGSLYSFLTENAIEFPLNRDMALQLIVGLSYLHVRKIIHRDLKSQNVLIASDYSVKISDFGCSKLMEGTSSLSNTVVGTPTYLSSEIVLESKPYTEQSDIYSKGIVLWEIFTNDANPFGAYPQLNSLNPLSIAIQIQTQNLRPKIEEIKDIKLAKVISQMWDKNPANRPELKLVSKLLSDLTKY